MRRTTAGVLTSALIAGVWLPAATLAQAPPAAEMEDILVTARKITENLHDVPMSVQALSGEFLDEANLTRLYELQFNTPGLFVNNLGLFGARFALRGVSDQGGGGMSVTTHLNGVYLGDANLALARLFDLERVEVLKGPQGTLYGRNSTGGSINFITRAPEDHFSAEIEGAYGSYSTARAEGHINLRLGGRRVHPELGR
jgi:iron complex outermembrane recepter protein